MTLSGMLAQAKMQLCPKGYVTKDNRADVLYSVFMAAKKEGFSKEQCRSGLRTLEKEMLGNLSKLSKETRDFIITYTKRDIDRCFYEVYGYDVEIESAPEVKVIVKEEPKEPLDLSRMIDEEYIRRKGIVVGPTLKELLDVDFCTKLGITDV